MQLPTSNRRLEALALLAQIIGLLALFYYYASLRIRPELFYQQKPDVFLFDSRFFHSMVSCPGGAVDYLAAFLSPLLAWNSLGALVVALLVALICWATRGLLAAVAGAGGKIVYLLPAVCILMVLGQYIHPVRLCVGLSIVLLGANLYVRLGGHRVGLRLAAFAIASAAVYFAAAGMYSIFACVCGCYEWSVKRQRWLGAACVLCAVVVPYAASWWPFDLILSEAYRGLTVSRGAHWLAAPLSMPMAIAIHTAALVLPLLAVLVFARLRDRSTEVPANPGDSSGEAGSAAGGPEAVSWKSRLAVPLAMLLLMVLADVLSFDSATRCLLEIDYNSQQRRWGEVLALAEELPFSDARAYDPRNLYCINRALFFEGRLLESMFAYPQVFSTPSLTLIHGSIVDTAELTPRQCSEVFFDLGRVNESEQMSYEALEQYGNRPEILKRLVYIYMIKGEPEAARRFLLLLERSLLHSGRARQVREQLDSHPAFSGSSLEPYRELMVDRDSEDDADNPVWLLKGLLERSPRNRMALEYLMAHYLLTRQPEEVLANCHRFDALDSPRFPRHVEEALVHCLAKAGQEQRDLVSRSIRRETWQRLIDFVEVERQSEGDRSAAFAALYPDFHDTYFFSSVFGHNIRSLEPVRPPE